MTVSRRLRFEILRRDGYTCRYCGARAPDVQLTVDHVIPAALGGSDEPSNLVTACQPCNSGKSSVQPDADLVEDAAEDALRWRRAIQLAAAKFAVERSLIESHLTAFKEAWDAWTYEATVTVPAPPVEPTGDPLIDGWHKIGTVSTRAYAEPVRIEGDHLVVRIERGWAARVRSGTTSLLAGASDLTGQRLRFLDREDGPILGIVPSTKRETTKIERRQLPLDPNWQESVERFLAAGLTQEDFGRFIRIAMTKNGVAMAEIFTYFCGCCWRHISDLQESARRILEAGGA